jgi:OPT family oligopeptide transporter
MEAPGERPSVGAAEPELTVRALAVGGVVGGLMCFSNMYFGLQTGWVTMGSLQSTILGFGAFRVLGALGVAKDFGPLENVVLQTTAVAAATMPLAGGFVGIVPALQLLGAESGGPVILSSGQLVLWCLGLGFFGVFFAVPLRHQTIIKENLTFPSGTATAHIIRVLHRMPAADADVDAGGGSYQTIGQAERAPLVAGGGLELRSRGGGKEPATEAEVVSEEHGVEGMGGAEWGVLFGCFAVSSGYTLAGHFVPILKNLPLGTWAGYPMLTAWMWTLQPSLSYVGQGLIMGPRTAASMLLGTLIGWGVLAPAARAAGYAPGPIGDSHTGAQGWLLWVSLATMLAESFVSLALISLKFCGFRRKDSEEADPDPAPVSQRVGAAYWLPGLVATCVLCTAVISPMFDLPLYQPVLATVFSLLVAVLAVRALGETDMSPVSGIGKVSQILFGVVAPGNVVANLVAGAIAEAGATSAGDLMQGLKCSHLLRASPRAQFYAQLVGTVCSCFFATAAWGLYSSTYQIPGPEFPAPTAVIWLDMAEVVNGGKIADNVLPTAIGAAVVAALLPLAEEFGPMGLRRWLPSAMSMAIGMYVTPNWTIPRVAGGLLHLVWKRRAPASAARYMVVAASGFVLGEGLTSIATAVLQSAGLSTLTCAGCPPSFCSGCP